MSRLIPSFLHILHLMRTDSRSKPQYGGTLMVFNSASSSLIWLQQQTGADDCISARFLFCQIVRLKLWSRGPLPRPMSKPARSAEAR